MCTVTVLPEAMLAATHAGIAGPVRLRVACNRDELVTRAAALPPATVKTGARRALMPVDPESGGTWIGANDAGLVCALLNVYDGSPQPRAALSRGTIIPALLASESMAGAISRTESLQAERYRPFRLLIVDRQELVECRFAGGVVERRRQPIRRAVMYTSSGLGDDVVAAPRAALFQQIFDSATDPVAAADLFHLHRWRGREAISVRMHRGEARTVSHTVVEVRDRAVSLAYRPADAPDVVIVTMAA